MSYTLTSRRVGAVTTLEITGELVLFLVDAAMLKWLPTESDEALASRFRDLMAKAQAEIAATGKTELPSGAVVPYTDEHESF